MESLRANPGGRLPVRAVVGRDDLVADIWDVLSRQSVQLTAERRIGKTHVLHKMMSEVPHGWTPMFEDLEKVHSAVEFAERVFLQVETHLSKLKKLANRSRHALQKLGGTEVGGVLTLPPAAWKTFLSQCVEDLVREQGDRKLVFLWDELPFMLAEIRNREGEGTATEVLDVLRSLRQEHDGFRMVLTGSIGLHHILAGLKQSGYSNAPLNDLHTIEVPPLGPLHARELASALIRGEGLECVDPEPTATAVAAAADCVPYYIHHIVRELRTCGAPASPEEVDRSVSRQMLDANDPWELSHYRDRLRTYYPGEEAVATAVLDVLATAPGPLGLDAVRARVASLIEFDDRRRLLELLKLMVRDHYLARDDSGFRMRFALIARWWRLDRELT